MTATSDSGNGYNPEKPTRQGNVAPAFGSDAIAQVIRELGLPYLALVPGASFRGLHDSLVNYLGNEDPQLLLCLHEEHAVAIAHGYAKVTGTAMGAIVHSNVGLQHATMAIFNAYGDRMPVVVLGATGPVDAAKRRPFVDWIHTARDQGSMIRGYVKWDDQPASPAAARESLARAKWIAETVPKGPVYINLDAGIQEAPLEEPLPADDLHRFMPAVRAGASRRDIAALAKLLRDAKQPLILTGRHARSEHCWHQRVALAEVTGAGVLTSLRLAASFPSDHPHYRGCTSPGFPSEVAEAVRQSDLIVSLDCSDLAGTLQLAFGGTDPTAKIVQISLDHRIHNGWNMDHLGLPPVDLFISADPDEVVADLLDELSASPPAPSRQRDRFTFTASTDQPGTRELAFALRDVIGDKPISFVHLPLSWEAPFWPLTHPLDFLGNDGGGGIGGGPGIAVGAALALKDTGRLAIAICGDGDFVMGVTALWTAVHYRIPLLVIIANNRSYYNDEVHQERVAQARGRPVENKWIGQRMSDPDIDLIGLAVAQGAFGIGPIDRTDHLMEAYTRAIAAVEAGGVAVVDVRIRVGGPLASTAATSKRG